MMVNVQRQSPWIPAFAGMTMVDPVRYGSECRREPCAFFSPKKNLALSLRKAYI